MGKEEYDGKKYTGYDDRFSTYVWNPETKQFFGRTGLMWAKLTIFYLIFYFSLAAFAGLCYYLFSFTLSDERPKWMLDKSIIGTNPGLGYRPMPDPDNNADSTLIWFDLVKKGDSAFWYKQLEAYIHAVENPDYRSDEVVECDYESTNQATERQSCRVDTSKFGPCNKAKKFGYDTGEPCILLKLNRILGWKPDCYGVTNGGESHSMNLLEEELQQKVNNEGMPNQLRDYIVATVKKIPTEAQKTRFLNTVWISCEGEQKPDQENMGAVAYYPQQGIPGFYFPFYKQQSYQSPFIFVQFQNPTRGVLVNIECKAWARNIQYDRINRLGNVHFELLIDG